MLRLLICLLVMLPSAVFAQERIIGPWIWIALPYDGYCSHQHLDRDFLAKHSGGALTEALLVQRGAQPHDRVGSYWWTSAAITPGGNDNLHELLLRHGKINKRVWGHAAYGVITLHATTAQYKVPMRIGSDDGIKVWLNGELVHSNNVMRTSDGLQDEFLVNLKAGGNLLVVKIFQCTDNWSFSAAINAAFTAAGKSYLPAAADTAAGLKNFSAEALVRQAEQLIRDKKPEEARKLLDEARSIAPRDGFLDFRLGQAYRQMGRHQEAVTALQRCWDKGYREPAVWQELSDALWDLGQYAQVIETSTTAVSWHRERLNEPKKEEYHRRQLLNYYGKIARSQLELGKFREAVATTDQAYALHPSTDQFNLALARAEAFYLIAEENFLQDRFGQVEPYLLQSQEAAKRNAVYLEKYFNGWRGFPSMFAFIRKRIALGTVTPEYTHRILVMYVQDVDVELERDGVKKRIRNRMTPELKQSALREQELLKRWFEAYSNGRFSLSFAHEDVGAIRRLRPNKGLDYFEVEDIEPSVAKTLFKYRNVDTFTVYWNGSDIHNTGRGGAKLHYYLPGQFRMPVIRGGMLITKNRPRDYWPMPGLLLHEFGHVIETMVGKGFVHCEDERKKNSYPGWDGNCDSLYHWMMASYLPGRWKELNWSVKRPDLTTEEAFNDALEQYRRRLPLPAAPPAPYTGGSHASGMQD